MSNENKVTSSTYAEARQHIVSAFDKEYISMDRAGLMATRLAWDESCEVRQKKVSHPRLPKGTQSLKRSLNRRATRFNNTKAA